MARLLVTRPIDEALRTAQALHALGHETLVDPMLTISFCEADLPEGPFDRVVVTSANALSAIRQKGQVRRLLGLPLLAVGSHTARVARNTGFTEVATPGRDLVAMIGHISQHWPGGQRVLYVAGSDRTGDLASLLAPFGHQVTLSVVYEARQTSRFQQATRNALEAGAVDGVLHYSARTAAAFLACAGEAGGAGMTGLRHLCLSAKVAAVLAAAGASQVEYAHEPEETSLFALIRAL